MYFEKKPKRVTALQLTTKNMDFIEHWTGGSIKGTRLPPEDRELELWSDGQEVRAVLGDFIVCEDGRFYPCKPDVFRRDFVPAEAP